VALVEVANSRGYPADHVFRIGKAGTLDRDLVRVIEAESYLFVTNNRQDLSCTAGCRSMRA